MDLSGKVALVTGGGRGIGRETCLAFARSGADVVVNYLQNQERAGEVVETIRGMGRKAVAVRADVGNKSEVEALFAQVDTTFGQLDILVNNAGTGRPMPLEHIELDFWDHILRTDLTGPFLVTQAAVKRMMPRNYGKIVNIASTAAISGMGIDPAYSAAKAGVLGFTKSLARYLGKFNITVNAISPGLTLTELSRALPKEILEFGAKSSAMGRCGNPEDVADAILFFASDYSRHVTGQMIAVDGGIDMP